MQGQWSLCSAASFATSAAVAPFQVMMSQDKRERESFTKQNLLQNTADQLPYNPRRHNHKSCYTGPKTQHHVTDPRDEVCKIDVKMDVMRELCVRLI